MIERAAASLEQPHQVLDNVLHDPGDDDDGPCDLECIVFNFVEDVRVESAAAFLHEGLYRTDPILKR